LAIKNPETHSGFHIVILSGAKNLTRVIPDLIGDPEIKLIAGFPRMRE
jgi:hypothetical protein